jgi:hypothetical protein
VFCYDEININEIYDFYDCIQYTICFW